MFAQATIPSFGMTTAFSGISSRREDAAAGNAPNPFATLVGLYQSNEVLLSELRSLRQKTVRAREYLASVGSNQLLGESQLLRLRARRSAALTLLRANRQQARRLFGDGDAPR